jgi:nucleoside-diphosphate-sugar epimerase
MKKILIVGAGGFIGSYIAPRLAKNNIVMTITKPGIDVTDAAAVRNILELSKPDFVINCLTFGGNETVNSNDPSIVAKNLAMYYNFKSNSDLFGRYINIGSGVEQQSSNNSAYAFSKRIISNDLDPYKFINLRLYGCFGSHEKDSRLLKKFLGSEGPFVLKDDRNFDYISISDFYNILEYVIDNEPFRHIDCVYEKKRTLSEFLRLFCDINNIDKEIIVESTSNNSYTGDSFTLKLMQEKGLELYGVMYGMKEYMK